MSFQIKQFWAQGVMTSILQS